MKYYSNLINKRTSQITSFSIQPIEDISLVILSPGWKSNEIHIVIKLSLKIGYNSSRHVITCKNSRGFLKTPTPLGVPVRMTSPGSKVNNLGNKKLGKVVNLLS